MTVSRLPQRAVYGFDLGQWGRVTVNDLSIKRARTDFWASKKYNNYFKGLNEEVNQSLRKSVLNCKDNEVVAVAGGNYIGDGSYSVATNEKNTIMIQIGGDFSLLLSRLYGIIDGEIDSVLMSEPID